MVIWICFINKDWESTMQNLNKALMFTLNQFKLSLYYFNTELKSGWIRMYMCYIDSIRRPSFAGNPEWSDFSPVLKAIDWSVYCKSNKSQLQGSLHKCAGWLLPLMPSSLHTGFLDSWQTGSSKSSQTKWQGSRELLKSVIYYQIL